MRISFNRAVTLAFVSGGAHLLLGCVSPMDAAAVEYSLDDASVAVTSQAFTEGSCASTAPDSIQSGPATIAISPDANYTHATCSNSFIVQVTSTNPGYRANVSYEGISIPPTGPISGCDGMWVNMSLYKLNGGSFTKVADAPFTVGAPTVDGTACLRPNVQLGIPSAGTYKVIGQAGFALSYQKVRVNTVRADVHDMWGQDSRGYTADGDWAPGLLKGECSFANSQGTHVNGISRLVGGDQGVKNLYCANGTQLASNTTLDVSVHDDRRSTSSGDWDPGFIKAECPQGGVLTGVAQTTTGVLRKARCAPVSITTDTCHVLYATNGDQRDTLLGGDWSVGDHKVQCEEGMAPTGFSKDANGKLRGLLCCMRRGHAT